MSIRPLETVNKALLSSTSSFVGEYESEGMLFTHAWPNFSDSSSSVRRAEGPASRNAFVFAFETPPLERSAGAALPNYRGMPELFSWYASLLFGKRFDNHGLTETIGLFNLPNLDHFSNFCRHTLPHNSHRPRVDFPVPLDLAEIRRISPLMTDTGPAKSFVRIFQTAAKFYAQALQTFERDAEVAYLHLVTSIEILSSLLSAPSTDLYDASTKHYLSVVEHGLPDGTKIAKHFRGKLLSIKKRFVRTITDLVDEDFFTRSESSEQFSRLKCESLVKNVAAAYDLRSQYVHTGVPFGRWIERSLGGVNCEVQVGRPVVESKSYGKTLANAPTFVGLERLVRYCLLKSAERHGAYLVPILQPNA